MAGTSSGGASVVYFAVAVGVIGPVVWFAVARRRGDPRATLRELGWTWAGAVAFMFCASVAVTYSRWRWLLAVAIAISIASTARQLLAFRQARKRERGR